MDDLIGYEDFYSIDQAGRVWSKKLLRFIRPHVVKGCHKVNLTDANGRYLKCVHQLVARQYLPNPHAARTVRHLNDVKIDNRVGNLQWRIPKPKKQRQPVPTNMVPITGYEGLYSMNRQGQVWSDRRSRCLKSNNCKGYLRVSLYKDGVKQSRRIHRLLGLQFIPNPANFPDVDHMNTDRSDNRLSNLRWATGSTNMRNRPLSKANTSGVQGVYWLPKNKSFAAIWRGDRKQHSKSFKTLEDATAYRNQMVDLHYDRPNLLPPCISHELQRKPPTSPRPSSRPEET